jgi:phosphatidate cytidylyltransferase
LIMAPAALAIVFAGRIVFILAVAATAIAALRELIRVSALRDDRWLPALLYGGTIGLAFVSLLPTTTATSFATPFGGFTVVAASVTGLILLTPIMRNRARGELPLISLGLIAFVYLGWMFGQLGLLANLPHAYGLICFVIFATEVSDIAAFTFGRLFGRHPLRSEISPSKTWEGGAGAVAVAMILPWALRFALPSFDAKTLVLIGLIVGLGGQLGDLSISVIKRELGIKDMGAAIPGHGGVLDRIDSLIYVAPLFMQVAVHAQASR